MNKLQDKQILTLAVVVTVAMLATAGYWGVIETSEARYAEISREMLQSGDWLHPTFLNIYHYHKPPFTYWITAVAYSVLGVNPFAARFFLAISYAIQIVLVVQIGQRLFADKQVALHAGVVYAALPIVLISARGLTTDSFLCTFVLLALYCWIMFSQSGKILFIYGLSVAMGLAFMTKGPVAFVVPGFVMAGFKKRDVKSRLSIAHGLAALLVFLVVGFGWFAFLIFENASYADYFFFHHFVDRIAHAEVFARKEPWYYYLLIIPLTFLPWIVIFIANIFRRKTAVDRTPVRRVALWWFLFPLILFSISSSKLVLYILPLAVGFSLVTGYYLSVTTRKAFVYSFVVPTTLVYIALIAITAFVPQFNVDLELIVVPFAAIAVSLAVLLSRGSRKLTVVLPAVFSITLILFSAQLFNLNAIQINSIKPVASFIKQNNLHDRNILVYNELLPSLAFELDQDIISLYGGNRALRRETQFETNRTWNQFLIDVTDAHGVNRMKSLLSKECVLVMKGDLPLTLKLVITDGWQKKTFGKWIVYYN